MFTSRVKNYSFNGRIRPTRPILVYHLLPKIYENYIKSYHLEQNHPIKKIVILLEAAISFIGTYINYPIHIPVWDWNKTIQPDVIKIGYRSSSDIYKYENISHVAKLTVLRSNISNSQDTYIKFLEDYKKTPEVIKDIDIDEKWRLTIRDSNEQLKDTVDYLYGYEVYKWPRKLFNNGTTFFSPIDPSIVDALVRLGFIVDGIYYPNNI